MDEQRVRVPRTVIEAVIDDALLVIEMSRLEGMTAENITELEVTHRVTKRMRDDIILFCTEHTDVVIKKV